MRTIILLSVGILIFVMGCVTDRSEEIAKLKQEIADLKTIAGPPPSSLDNLYPPKAEAPILLLKMFEISTPFGGIAIDMSENDLEHAKANFERFKVQYDEVSKLVPEWEKAYPMEPVEEMGEALETGDQGKVMAAFAKVDKLCHDCHVANMLKVQYKYHWEDYSTVSVTDPVTKEDVDFNQFMWYLDRPFIGILVDIEQGEVENALKHFEILDGRFQTLKETCYPCHDTEREYFVGQSVQALMDKVEAALRTESPDSKLVAELIQGIGIESCFKCHLVHLPAAFTKVRWNEREKMQGE